MKSFLATLWLHVRNTLYAVRMGLTVITGIGRSKSHQTYFEGLKFRHFAVGGVIAAILIVSTIVMLVRQIVPH